MRVPYARTFFRKEDFIRKSTKTTLLTKYTQICSSHHQLNIQTLYIIQNEIFYIKIHIIHKYIHNKNTTNSAAVNNTDNIKKSKSIFYG